MKTKIYFAIIIQYFLTQLSDFLRYPNQSFSTIPIQTNKKWLKANLPLVSLQ